MLKSRPELLILEDDHAGPVAGAPYRSLAAGREVWAVVRSVSNARNAPPAKGKLVVSLEHDLGTRAIVREVPVTVGGEPLTVLHKPSPVRALPVPSKRALIRRRVATRERKRSATA